MILKSMPGIGRINLAALLSEGSGPLSRRDYPALRTLCGAAPVTRRSGKSALALAHPQQGSFRIPADRGLHEVIQGFQKTRLCLARRLAAAPLSSNPQTEHHRARTQVCQGRDRSYCALSLSTA